MPRLWIGSWNMGNKKAAPAELNNVAATLMPRRRAQDVFCQMPELVILGLQESPARSRSIKGFQKYLPGYQQVTAKSALGKTKPFEPFNTQSIGVWIAASVAKKAHLVGSSFARTSLSGKGGHAVVIEWLDDQRGSLLMGFITAHFGTKIENHTAEMRAMLAGMQSLVPHHQTLDAIFYMGDFNQRVPELWSTIQAKQRRQAVYVQPGKSVFHNTSPVAKLSHEVNADVPQEEIVKILCDPHGRNRLAGRDPLAKFASGTGFQFPIPRGPDGNVCFPTYKRRMGGGATKNPGVLIQHAPPSQLPDLVRQCYFTDEQMSSQEPLKHNAKRQGYNIGWLDRIGYKLTRATTGNMQIRDIPNVWTSDHAPVYMTINVLGPHRRLPPVPPRPTQRNPRSKGKERG